MDRRYVHTISVCSLRWSGGLCVIRLPAGSWNRLPHWQHCLCMRCIVSSSTTSFPWLIFFFAAVLWGSMIHKHTRRWVWRGSAVIISWKWEKCSCCSKLVSTFSMLPSSVLSWRVSQAWNPRHIQQSVDTLSLWPSIYFDLLVDATDVVCHQLGLLSMP